MLSAVRTLALSTERRQEIFTMELLKSGVEPKAATEVARIVATELADEQLTSKQVELVKAACTKWLKERKRQNFVDEIIQQFPIR